MHKKPKIIIVGGGLAGLMATIKANEAGAEILLFSLVPVKRSHSVCAQGGVNAARDVRGEGDSPWEHFDDTIDGGDFLANQELPKGMCEAAPAMVELLDRMGVPFNRTPEGHMDVRRFGGAKHARTHFSGATTGQQMLYALDEQVRRAEVEGAVTKFEHWSFLSLVKDGEGHCRGITAMDLKTLEVRAFSADAVLLATGGCGLIYGPSTNSVVCTGSAASAAYQQGAVYANGEFIQVHPTALAGEDKRRLMSESARGEGGRMWTWKDGKKWYFLEDWYPEYGNLVPRDIASRAIFKVVNELGLGVEGKEQVYLDLTHIPAAELDRKLGGILEIYEKYMGVDPREFPMLVYPAVHYTMGGLWVDYQHMTSIPGLFAAGEVDYQYHGANRLGANALLHCLYAGQLVGKGMLKFARGLESHEAAEAACTEEVRRQNEWNEGLLKAASHGETPHGLHREMGRQMWDNVSIIRENDKLRATDDKLQELGERYRRVSLEDSGRWLNQSLVYARDVYNMLQLSRAITLGALARDESRGAHYKPAFPERDDENWLKTTRASWTAEAPELEYEAVDVQYIEPRERRYDVSKGSEARG